MVHGACPLGTLQRENWLLKPKGEFLWGKLHNKLACSAAGQHNCFVITIRNTFGSIYLVVYLW